ncbi:MAG: L,D-transpeptidase family protein [Saccharofermentans sp.]|nr:L,D-transpeptidase family protein [Saccharofermentans sp.]
MNIKNHILTFISVIAASSVLLGISSCHVNTTVNTDIEVVVNGSEVIGTGNSIRETVPTSSESQTETTVISEDSSMPETSETVPEETTTESSEEIKDMSPEWVRNLPQAKDNGNDQLFIVAASGMDQTSANVSLHERDENGNWIEVLSVDGCVGKNGMVYDEERKEGCGRTPIGIYRFNMAFGIAPDPGCAFQYVQVTDDLYWSGDMREGMHYNEMISINDCPDLDTKNSEHLIDYTKAYQYCLNISFNEECTIGKGSAIFLHCFGSNRNYTAGCVAVSEEDMVTIMNLVDPECVVIIDTADNLGA